MDRVTTSEQSVMPKNPVIIVHALAGDLLMMSPTLRFFARHVGDTVRLICGVEKNIQDLLRQIGFERLMATTFSVEKIVTDEHGERTYWTCETGPVRAALEGADLVINLLEFTGDSLASVIAQSAVPSLGFHEAATHRLAFDFQNDHLIDSYFQFAHHFLPDAVAANYMVFPHRPDGAQIRQRLAERLGADDYVVIHTDTKPQKMWPLANWKNLLDRLWETEPDLKILLVGYPFIPLEKISPDPRLIDCRDIPLTVSYEVVAGARLFIGIDSSMLHAADFCRVPTLAIFASRYPTKRYGIKFAISRTLVGANPPDDIEVSSVFQGVLEVAAAAGVPIRLSSSAAAA